jgi:hypothetical protein
MELFFLLANQDALAWVGPVVQLVQLGGFGALVWFYNWHQIPNMQKQHSDERREWVTYMHERDAKFESLLERAIQCIGDTNARR